MSTRSHLAAMALAAASAPQGDEPTGPPMEPRGHLSTLAELTDDGVRSVFGRSANPSLLETVRAAVHGYQPRDAVSPPPAASTAVAPTQAGATAPGSHATIDPVCARATFAAARAVLGPGGSATRAQPSQSRTPAGVDPKAIFASRRQQAAAASAGKEAPDTGASRPTTQQGRPRLPNAASVYEARRASNGEDRC